MTGRGPKRGSPLWKDRLVQQGERAGGGNAYPVSTAGPGEEEGLDLQGAPGAWERGGGGEGAVGVW